MGKEYICGIDENGFGAILGPLVITGTIAEDNLKISENIKDSKLIYRKRRDFLKIEEIAILFFYVLKKRLPTFPFEIYKTFADGDCNFSENICEKNIPSEFLSEKEKILEKYESLIKNFEKIKEIKSKLVCPYFFNQFLKKKNSKFILNLSKFCEIIKEEEKYKNIKFFCGKIGAFSYYQKYLYYFFPQYQIKTICETHNFSKYIILKENFKFEVGFYKDVESFSSPAAISSIIGKYIREILMESIRKSLKIKEEISGYRDRRTKKFLGNLKNSNINIECIIRHQ